MTRGSLFLLTLLVGMYGLCDLYGPIHNDLRNFDPTQIGSVESKMWRCYYEKNKIKLFTHLASLLRKQTNAPCLRSYLMAYHAAAAATTFQKGHTPADYEKALEPLEKYFSLMNGLSQQEIDPKKIAALELAWWIERRKPKSNPKSWAALIASIQSEIFGMSMHLFDEYAAIRVEGMLMRDAKRDHLSEMDWVAIESSLVRSWRALHQAVNAISEPLGP